MFLPSGDQRGCDVERHPVGDARGFAAGDRQRVDVAGEVEDERLPVRRDVERHPRALVGREADGARGLERELGATSSAAARGGVGALGMSGLWGREGCEQRRGEREPVGDTHGKAW